MVVKKKFAFIEKSGAKGIGGLTQTQYVNLRGEVCPACRHDGKLICHNQLLPEDGIAHRDLTCSECGSTWTEQFTIVGFCNFRSAGGSRDKKARRRERRLARQKGSI